PFFVAFERIANRQMFGEADEHGLIGFDSRCLRGYGCESLAQSGLRSVRKFRHLGLKRGGGRKSGLSRADCSETGKGDVRFENFLCRRLRGGGGESPV